MQNKGQYVGLKCDQCMQNVIIVRTTENCMTSNDLLVVQNPGKYSPLNYWFSGSKHSIHSQLEPGNLFSPLLCICLWFALSFTKYTWTWHYFSWARDLKTSVTSPLILHHFRNFIIKSVTHTHIINGSSLLGCYLNYILFK